MIVFSSQDAVIVFDPSGFPKRGSESVGVQRQWCGRLGKTELVAYQVSARGGVVRMRVNGERVLLGGQAVTVLRGELQA